MPKKFDWWKPTTEREMRQRYEDAIEKDRLVAEEGYTRAEAEAIIRFREEGF